MPWYSLDVFSAMAEENAQDDQALARRCIEGLTGYAAELRQRAGPGGQARTQALRKLVDSIASYWGLWDEELPMVRENFLIAFDCRMKNADTATAPLQTSAALTADVLYGLYRYGLDLIPNMGSDAAEELHSITSLIQEAAKFWDVGSPVVDQLCTNIDAALKHQTERERAPQLGGYQ